MLYDMIVIGGGPAGVSAAVYARSRGMSVLLFEDDKIGGLVGKVSTVTHYAAIVENETGASFSERLKAQAVATGTDIKYEKITRVNLGGETKIVETENGTYEAKTIILANGTSARKLGIPGEKELAGNGIGLNAARDAERYSGKNIYVVGGADGAIKEAIYLAKYAKKLTIIHFEKKLGAVREFMDKLAKLDNVEVKTGTRLTAVMGNGHVEKLEVTDVETGNKEIIEDDGCGIFVYAGTTPNTSLYNELGLIDGYIPVNERMETEIEGVFAAGDIRIKQVRQVSTAVADGTIAAINAFAFINR